MGTKDFTIDYTSKKRISLEEPSNENHGQDTDDINGDISTDKNSKQPEGSLQKDIIDESGSIVNPLYQDIGFTEVNLYTADAQKNVEHEQAEYDSNKHIGLVDPVNSYAVNPLRSPKNFQNDIMNKEGSIINPFFQDT